MPHGRAAPLPVSQNIQRTQCISGHFSGCDGSGTARQFIPADGLRRLRAAHKIINKVRCLRGVGDVSPLGCRFVGGAAAAHFAAAGARAGYSCQRTAWPGARTIRATARAAVAAGRPRSSRCRARSRRRAPRSSRSSSAACASPAARSTAPRISRRSTRDIIGREVPVTAIYDVAQRITAKYGDDGYVLSRAIVPPQELTPARRDRAHPDHRRLYRPGRMAGRRCRSTATSSRTTRPRSPPSARSMSKRSSATCCWPATCPA